MTKVLLYIVTLVVAQVLLSACSSKGEGINENPVGPIEIIHYNVVITPDLSNRLDSKLYPRPLNDNQIVKVVLKNIYTTILTRRRSENQRDKFSVSFINRKLINQYNINTAVLGIDFDKFKRQKDRIDYIKG